MKISNMTKTVSVICVTFGVLTFGSCKKTTEEIVADITPQATATVGGNAWSTKIAAGVSSTLFVITAKKDKEAVVLTLPSKDKGVYPIDIISTNASYLPIFDSLSNAYIAFSGSIEITDINAAKTQINGKFEFTAANSSLDTIKITNGILKNIPVK
jgi:hypothetical protein